jgi:predicted 2-oxoglutarate/Fe(II)-dependent dioxygenase YbiX/peroxiredoxin
MSSSSTATTGPVALKLLPGDPAPWFYAATASNPRYNFASVGGRYVLLAFPGPASHPGSAEAHRMLRAAQAARLFDDQRAAAFVVSIDPADDAPGGPSDALPGLRVFRDRDGAVSRLYGVLQGGEPGKTGQYLPAVFLLDPLLRVMFSAGLSQLPGVLDLLRRLPPPGSHAGMEVPAPVLVLPRVFEPELCRRLIAAYEQNGGKDSGFMVEKDGKTVGVYDYNSKRRRDHDIEDEALRSAINARVTRRLVPEMRKAFQFKATRIERYIVACYDGTEGGHFKAHRDNTTPGTAHRRFAVTINLNDDFDGGELWFPEFGTRRYRPPAGGAVVFSCSLLHEATPVTRGVRYATLPFLYDDEAAEIRHANMHSIVDTPPPGAEAPPAAGSAQAAAE